MYRAQVPVAIYEAITVDKDDQAKSVDNLNSALLPTAGRQLAVISEVHVSRGMLIQLRHSTHLIVGCRHIEDVWLELARLAPQIDHPPSNEDY